MPPNTPFSQVLELFAIAARPVSNGQTEEVLTTDFRHDNYFGWHNLVLELAIPRCWHISLT
jgi:hypothetical protein